MTKIKLRSERTAIICDLIILFGSAVLLLLLTWNKYPPLHDTRYVFHVFHFFYTQFVEHQHLPGWFPYGNFGVPAHYLQMISISPVSYVMVHLCSLLKLNSLSAFQFSTFIELLIYGSGIYAVGNQIFRHRICSFLAAFSALATTVWHVQIFWNLRLVYLFPWVLYLLLRSANEKRGIYFWGAGILCLVSLIGSLPYFLILNVLVLSFFLGGLFWKQRSTILTAIFGGRFAIATMVLFTITAASYVYFLRLSMQDLIHYTDGRNPHDLKVSLLGFLTYGSRMFHLHKLSAILTGTAIFEDIAMYLGLLPAIAIPYLFVLWKKTHMHRAFGVSLFLSLWFAAGGLFAVVLYKFPGVAIYRHLAHAYGMLRVLILLSGFLGIDALLSGYAKNPKLFYEITLKIKRIVTPGLEKLLSKDNRIFTVLVLLFAFDLLLMSTLGTAFLFRRDLGLGILDEINYFFINPMGHCEHSTVWAAVGLWISKIIIVCAIVYRFCQMKTYSESLMRWLICSFIVFDVTSYALMVQMAIANVQNPVSTIEKEGIPLAYVPIREEYYLDPTYPKLEWMGEQSTKTSMLHVHKVEAFDDMIYFVTYQFENADPCIPRLKMDFMMKNVHHMLANRGGILKSFNDDRFLPPQDDGILMAIGCRYSKMRLYSSWTQEFWDELSPSEITKLRRSADYGAKAYLDSRDGQVPIPKYPEPSVEVFPKNVVFSSDRIEFTITNGFRGPSLLVYADAYSSDWTATVDGIAVPLYLSNFAFKGVFIPAGKSQIVLQYRNLLMEKISHFLWTVSCFALFIPLLILGRALYKGFPSVKSDQ